MRQAALFEAEIRRDIAALPTSEVDKLVKEAEAALKKGDPASALPLAMSAARSAPANAFNWRLIARAARLIKTQDWSEKEKLYQRGTAAAFLGYLRSTNKAQEGLSLWLLAQIYESREEWRPALTAYRYSLEANEDADTRKTYEALRDKYGFRITGYEVDSDAASPRVCFTFSEPLAKGRVDFSPYVAMSGKGDFAVSAEESQLCVDGLRHGERYAAVLRAGIPSVIASEALTKNADYEFYVRDRAAFVRTTGTTYVLPSTGQQGIPLTSVNTNKVQLKVFRVGDRNLINAVRTDFLKRIDTYSLSDLQKNSGLIVWQGEMTTQVELNRDVITAFPVLEATGRLEPGVYVLAAEAGEKKPRDSDSGFDMENPAIQWFIISDLGMTAFTGGDGVNVLIRSLASAAPLRDVEVRLLARNNEILGTARTDALGRATFDPGLARGEGGMAPGLITAQIKEDYSFLDLAQAAFDLTDRGVAGRLAPKGLDAFLYTERGVYRPGESVFLTALLRDARGNAVSNVPLTLVVKRPDGVEYHRSQLADQGGGGRALVLPLQSGVATGTWRALAYADPKRPPLGEITFLVDDYVPERLDMVLDAKSKTIASGAKASIDVNVRYLYGAPGAEIALSSAVTVRRAKKPAIPGLEDYIIGLWEEEVSPLLMEHEEKPLTDAKGAATLTLASNAPIASVPLEAEFVVSATESGGRAISRTLTLPILPKSAVLGVRPLFAEGSLTAGAIAKFALVMADPAGNKQAKTGIKWQLQRVSRNYQWFKRDGVWNYDSIRTLRRIADGEIATTIASPVEISAPIEWGTYRLEVRSEGAETSYDFTVGYSTDTRADTPDVLDVKLDKSAYLDGEAMQVRLTPRFAGKTTLAVMSDKIVHLDVVDMPAEGITVSLPVKAEWGAGAYLVALAHRPLDEKAQRMPGRAIGLGWFSIDKAARSLEVKLDAPSQIRPRGTLNVPVTLTGLKPGEEAYVTLAAVDVGILNLTRFATPDPTNHFFGQRQLGTEIRDLYAYLIDGMHGVRGQIRSGGDSQASFAGAKPTQEPLARYSGIIKVGADGKANIAFDIPAFNGSVRLMAAAWTAQRTGQAQAEVIIRDPVVVQASVPRFLALGDQARLHIEINPVEAESGDYTLAVAASSPIRLSAEAASTRLKLEKGKKTHLSLPLTAASLGVGELSLTLTGPNGVNLTQALPLPVNPSHRAIVSRIVRPLQPGQSLMLSSDLLANFVPNTGAVAVSASPYAALDVPALLAALDRYPFGCTEQLVSRAMPLLYVNRLASREALALDSEADMRVQTTIERVLARQGSNGAFGLWGAAGGESLWLDAYVADFLTRARENGVSVPASAFAMTLDRLRNQVVNTTDVTAEDAPGIAYALYVLARNGRPVMGDLRYLTDSKMGDFETPLARAQLGAALAMLGDRPRANTAFEAAEAALKLPDDGHYRADYGSNLRDAAGLLALFAEGKAEPARILRAAASVDGARLKRRYTSTQEQVFMLLAAQALAEENPPSLLSADGIAQQGAFFRTLSAASLGAKALSLTNTTQSALRINLSLSGIPTTPEPAESQGYTVSRKFLTLKGEEAREFRQNERYVVLLSVEEKSAQAARLLLVDPLPAGLEIENAALSAAGSVEGMDFLGSLLAPIHSEKRDDRFVAAFDREAADDLRFSVAYIVRAVTPGRFTHPAAYAEDMYRPDVFGRTAYGSLTVVAADAPRLAPPAPAPNPAPQKTSPPPAKKVQ